METNTPQILRFLGENSDLPTAGEGIIIWFMEDGGRIRMFVEIQEDTTLEKIKRAWYLVTSWRERLEQWQFTRDALSFAWLETLARRVGYARAAAVLNEKIGKCLREYYEDCAAYTKARPGLTTLGDVIRWQHETGHWGFGLDHAINIMRKMGMSEEESRQIAEGALQSIAEGSPPFPPDFPITKNMVRERIRYRKQSSKPEVGKTG